MNGANICIFEGRLSRDPQYSTFNGQNGPVQKALFTVAVDRALSSNQRQAAKNDSSIKTADFIPCSLIGKQVETLQKYFSKGKGIRIVAHYQEYTTKDQQTGETKYGHTFEVDNIGFCVQDPKNQQGQQGQPNQYQNNGYQQTPPQGGYQQPQQYQQPPQQYQQPQQPQQGFSMFDESDSPF